MIFNLTKNDMSSPSCSGPFNVCVYIRWNFLLSVSSLEKLPITLHSRFSWPSREDLNWGMTIIYHCLFFSVIFFNYLAELRGHGNGWARRRLSLTEGHSSISLPPNNQRGPLPPRQKLPHARVLPHGLLPCHNFLRSCYRGLWLPQHEEDPCREVQGQWADPEESRLHHLLPLRGPLRGNQGNPQLICNLTRCISTRRSIHCM